MTHGFVCLPLSPIHPQLLPERLLLWPRLLCQHGSGEHGGERGEDEVCRNPVSFLHPALPLYELPGAPGQVRGAFIHYTLTCTVFLIVWCRLLVWKYWKKLIVYTNPRYSADKNIRHLSFCHNTWSSSAGISCTSYAALKRNSPLRSVCTLNDLKWLTTFHSFYSLQIGNGHWITYN